METAIRITWTRLIVGLILGVLLATILLLRAATPGPNTIITNRHSFQALLAVPRELRAFPVERYIAEGDWFIYRFAAPPRGRCQWRLQVAARSADLEKWKVAFRDYLEMRGESLDRTGSASSSGPVLQMYSRADRNPSSLELVRFDAICDELHITFAYYEAATPNKIWGTKYGRFLASILRRVGLPIDAVTHVT